MKKFPNPATGEDAARYLEACWQKKNGYRWRTQFDGDDFNKARRLLKGNSGLIFRSWHDVVAFLRKHNVRLNHPSKSKLPISTQSSVYTLRGGLCNGK